MSGVGPGAANGGHAMQTTTEGFTILACARESCVRSTSAVFEALFRNGLMALVNGDRRTHLRFDTATENGLREEWTVDLAQADGPPRTHVPP